MRRFETTKNSLKKKNNSVIIAMCVYDQLQYGQTDLEFKLIADIKDAVSVLADSYQGPKANTGKWQAESSN